MKIVKTTDKTSQQHALDLALFMQWKGIGRKLIEFTLEDCNGSIMTVNSAPFAHDFYKKVGFEDTDVEQIINGIRFFPMRNIINTKQSKASAKIPLMHEL